MTVFNVSLVVGNIELTDDEVDQIFEALPDAVASLIAGVATITSPIEAADPTRAAFGLVDLVRRVVPHAVPLRLDQDLVSISDVAVRTDRSRESVRLLVEGKRGPGGFPPPVGIVGDGIRVWPWATVLEWLKARLGSDPDEHGIPPEVAAVVDAELWRRRSQPEALATPA